jgi:lysozyme
VGARRLILFGALALAGLAAWRQASAALVGEGDAAPGFDPLRPLFSAAYSVGAEFGVGLAMTLSAEGLGEIARHEGLQLAPYQDVAGHWTIGYGHKLGPLESRASITAARALELLREDAREAENAVNALVTVALAQSQFDALVSLVFNIGSGAFGGSTLLRLLNEGDYAGAATQFARWNRAGGEVRLGLMARRDAEAQLFAQGVA